MLYSILMVFQVVLSIGIIALVLLQHGKGADAGAAFGSGASSTVFGSRGSGNFLSRSTAVLATVFFLNSLTLAYMAGNQPAPTSVIDTVVTPVEEVAPAVPEEGEAPAPVEVMAPETEDVPR